jgi:hypothetical protein
MAAMRTARSLTIACRADARRVKIGVVLGLGEGDATALQSRRRKSERLQYRIARLINYWPGSREYSIRQNACGQAQR